MEEGLPKHDASSSLAVFPSNMIYELDSWETVGRGVVYIIVMQGF